MSTKNLQLFNRFSMRWGGFAGDGLQSTGLLLQKYFNKLGYYVHGSPGTQSTIRGGHVWQHVEINTTPFSSFDRPLDLLVALNSETIDVHGRDMRPTGVILYNADNVSSSDLSTYIEKGIMAIGLELTQMARKVDLQTSVLANTVAVGAVLALLDLPKSPYTEVLKKRFTNRETIIKLNIDALELGFNSIKEDQVKWSLAEPAQPAENYLVISGNEMIALGAAASGLKFLAQYPITPASSILTYLSNHAAKLGVVVRQAEDELAAINMIIGASYTGVRAMTASSGPGLSLMSEGFGYASMTETPLVVVNAMRGGPSTGVPTKMEQADLDSMIHLSHGESPRLILAPRSIPEAFDITVRAFNLADRFQIPVIILSDFALSESTQNLPPFDMDVEIDRGKIWSKPTDEFPEFKRFQSTADSIAPRAFPGTPDAQYILVGAEHDEESHSLSGNRCGLPESWDIREKMIERRYKKFELLRQELQGPNLYGKSDAKLTLLCWGSTEGAVKELVDEFISMGNSVNMLSFADLYPLPSEKIRPYLTNIKTSVMIEVNFNGQFEELLHNELNWRADHQIHPLTGETPTASSLKKALSKLNLEEIQ